MNGTIYNPALGNMVSNLSGILQPEIFWSKFLSNIFTLAFIIGFVVSFLWLIMGAIKWILAGGDKQNYENARKQIEQAVIGLVVLIGIVGFMKLMSVFLSIDLFNLQLGPLYM